MSTQTAKDIDPFSALESALNCDPRDWARNPKDAWIYGIIVGWDDDALEEVARQFFWTGSATIRLKELHAAFKEAHDRFLTSI